MSFLISVRSHFSNSGWLRRAGDDSGGICAGYGNPAGPLCGLTGWWVTLHLPASTLAWLGAAAACATLCFAIPADAVEAAGTPMRRPSGQRACWLFTAESAQYIRDLDHVPRLEGRFHLGPGTPVATPRGVFLTGGVHPQETENLLIKYKTETKQAGQKPRTLTPPC